MPVPTDKNRYINRQSERPSDTCLRARIETESTLGCCPTGKYERYAPFSRCDARNPPWGRTIVLRRKDFILRIFAPTRKEFCNTV